ncbi:MAG: alpha/beta hydrolase [Lewinellaceae bacterium]|nr:alpha/beta hydrolase [Lewinellaceae bacterium]
MRFIKYLSIFLTATFTLFNNSKAHAQILDSIKYEYGLLYFHQYGPSSLPPVIILTGGPGNSYTQLEEMAKSMSTKFRCILVEQRGTGRSIPDPFNSKTVNVNSVTSDIKLLMENLHLDQAIIVGHSWGGMLAMNFAATFPDQVEHLVLLAPGPHKDARNGFFCIVYEPHAYPKC